MRKISLKDFLKIHLWSVLILSIGGIVTLYFSIKLYPVLSFQWGWKSYACAAFTMMLTGGNIFAFGDLNRLILFFRKHGWTTEILSDPKNGPIETSTRLNVRWLENKSQLFVAGFRSNLSHREAEKMMDPLSNFLRSRVLSVTHSPGQAAFIFNIDRTPEKLPVEEMKMDSGEKFAGYLGKGSSGKVIPFRYDLSPTLDIKGPTGSGKTEAAKSIALSILRQDPRPCREVILIDPKSVGREASSQFQEISNYCHEKSIPFTILNPDECEVTFDEEGRIIAEDFTGLKAIRKKLAAIHADYRALSSKTETAPHFYMLIGDEASNFLDPGSRNDKNAKVMIQEIAAQINLWSRLFRSTAFGPLILISQSARSDSLLLDPTNLQYRLLSRTGTAQLSESLVGDDRLYRDPSYRLGKFHCIAIPEGYQGPIRTPYGSKTKK